MAKISALTTVVTVDDANGTPRIISGDVTDLSINTSRGEQDITGLDKSAMERLLLRSDTTISLSGVYNPGATPTAHAVFSSVGTQAGTVSRTTAIGLPTGTATGEFVPANYNLSIGADGAATWSVELHTSNGTAIVWS